MLDSSTKPAEVSGYWFFNSWSISGNFCISNPYPKQGWIQRGRLGRSLPLKPTKVNLFNMILYNSENDIRDFFSSIVMSQQCREVYFISLTVAKSLSDLTTKYYW